MREYCGAPNPDVAERSCVLGAGHTDDVDHLDLEGTRWSARSRGPSHPETFYITAAARTYLNVRRANPDAGDPDNWSPPTAANVTAAMWEALTGLTGADALAYAEQIERDAVTAVVVPF